MNVDNSNRLKIRSIKQRITLCLLLGTFLYLGYTSKKHAHFCFIRYRRTSKTKDSTISEIYILMSVAQYIAMRAWEHVTTYRLCVQITNYQLKDVKNYTVINLQKFSFSN